jgi:small ligand-binding sensory domain FIST
LIIVHASSLYEEPSKIISTIIEVIEKEGGRVKNIVGNTAGGIVGGRYVDSIQTIEAEAVPAVSVTLLTLPEVEVKTFYWNDCPEANDVSNVDDWKKFMGMDGFCKDKPEEEEPVFMLIPSPAFQNNLDDLLQGISHAYPSSQTFGGIASTVSSLSRARIFAYEEGGNTAAYGNGCVGVGFCGDLRVDTMIAQGAKPGKLSGWTCA